MPYTIAEPGLYGQTYKATLLTDEVYTIAGVYEPGLVFERDFSVLINTDGAWGGIQVTEEGKPDLYVWKAYGAEMGGYTPSVVVGFTQGQGLKLLCTAGQFIFTWRERYRLGR